MKLIFSEVIDRLKSKLGIIEDQVLAKMMGMSPASFSERRTRESIPYEKIITICREHGISSDYIFSGNAEELNGKIIFECDRSDIDEDKMMVVPYFENIRSISDGHTKSLSYIVLPKNEHPELTRESRHLNAVTAVDDSMEGTILNGGMFLYDSNDQEIESGKIYVVRFSNEIMLKRLFIDISEPEKIILKADNIYYEKFAVNSSEVEVIGRVMFVYNRGKLI